MSSIFNSNDFIERVLGWYDNNPHYYPWRENREPYRVWLSEIMLQQTQVNTVIPYYKDWLKDLININEVADADLEYILKKWEGLGYYARARNFHSACKIVSRKFKGKVPMRYDQFINLPGVGPYVAGAVLSIAYNLPIPAVDGNAQRVFSRLYEINLPASKSRNIILTKLSNYISNFRPGDFNQAIMDLGKTVCTFNNPKCLICPVQNYCQAHMNNSVNRFPPKEVGRKKPNYRVAVGVIQNDNQFLISKRKENGLLGGLWEFPGGKIMNDESAEDCIRREVMEELGVSVAPTKFIKRIQHEYSHFSITLDAYFCDFLYGNPASIGCSDWKWANLKEIYTLPFPKANHKLFGAVERAWKLC